ncbi:MAG: YceD family protein [Pseudomonadota bacterium]
MTAPEFSRERRLDQIGAGETIVEIGAEPGECAALAARFGLLAIDSLDARYAIRRDNAEIRATGHLSARVTQACVASHEPVPAVIEEDFDLRFLPEAEPGADEVELSEAECDTVFYTGGAIDLGEAAAETLALALDPFPRSPVAAQALKAAGVLGEDEVGPFSGLAALRDKLGK